MELLIRIVDSTHADPNVDHSASKRGDVIVAVPDNWPWSHRELTNPDWRIVRIPGLSQQVADDLTTPEQPADESQTETQRKKLFRLWKWDIDGKAKGAVRSALAKPRTGDGVDAVIPIEDFSTTLTKKK